MKEKDLVDLERFKKNIDEDFENFPKNKRFYHLQKCWISCVSHKILGGRLFMHDDRKILRKKLMKYLNNKIKDHNYNERWGK